MGRVFTKRTRPKEGMFFMRVGIGYDAHVLTKGRSLVLGGETIPYDKGLLGHSDADVLLHAIMDALLGAAGLGDIGQHFPDTDDKYKNASSLHLLEKVHKAITDKSFAVVNVDAVIVAQSPKLSHLLQQMAINISQVLHLPPSSVNIKATTEEGMGFTGTGQGIAAHAICLLESVGACIIRPQN